MKRVVICCPLPRLSLPWSPVEFKCDFVWCSLELASTTRIFCHVSAQVQQLRNAGRVAREKNEMSFEQKCRICLNVECRDAIVEHVEFFKEWDEKGIQILWL